MIYAHLQNATVERISEISKKIQKSKTLAPNSSELQSMTVRIPTELDMKGSISAEVELELSCTLLNASSTLFTLGIRNTRNMPRTRVQLAWLHQFSPWWVWVLHIKRPTQLRINAMQHRAPKWCSIPSQLCRVLLHPFANLQQIHWSCKLQQLWYTAKLLNLKSALQECQECQVSQRRGNNMDT